MNVISLSGGLDSAVLLAHLLQWKGHVPSTVLAVGFNYGSKHNTAENIAAAKIAGHYGVNFTVLDIQSIVDPARQSALTAMGKDVPEGHYEAENMRQTVVPGRNLIFASILAGMAESMGSGIIYLGVHAGDHFIYPDCRLDFLASLRETITLSTEGKVGLCTPFVNMDKKQIVGVGMSLGVPFQLTRTCYKGDPDVACGVCGSCQERLEAFHANGAEDPILYRTRELLPK